MKPRYLAAVAAICVASVAVSVAPFSNGLDGLSLDTLFWLRHQVAPVVADPPPSSVAVIAIDEETYRRPPFANVPKVMWTPQIAKVLSAVVAADAAAVGFDVILPTSVERFLPGFDRDFLVALRRASLKNRVVLGKVQHQRKPIGPYRGQSFAVGNAKNIRAVNLYEDDDGVIRRVPLWFRATGADGRQRIETAMAMEMAARTASAKIAVGPGGTAMFDGHPVPQRGPGSGMLLNFDTRPGAIPTYSLADLAACVERGDTDYFRRHFAGKAVLIGAVLDVEDRKLTSMRLATSPEGIGLPERCALPVMASLYRKDLRRDTIPGVYIHATAINNLLHGTALRQSGRIVRTLILFGLVAATVAAVLALPAWWAGATIAALLAVWTVVATVAFARGFVLPLLRPDEATIFAFVLAFAFRFTVADRDKRRIRQAFSLYLPAPEVERLVASDTAPTLGGESRVLTVLFSDIADFTRISEGLSPRELVSFLNRYLTLMTDTIEAHGGIVDKYIGDAVIGVFGAPLENPDHALNAVRAALACNRILADSRAEIGLPDNVPLATRFGINTGEMVIGNIGSSRRFNYTVMGDAVNLASRLEGANKEFGTFILVSDETRHRCGEAIRFREIARARVLGRQEPTAMFEPLGEAEGPADRPEGDLAAFEEARAAFEAGAFGEAARGFAAIETADRAARLYRQRAETMAAVPPEDGWDGVINLDRK